jgi:hypothetical protein
MAGQPLKGDAARMLNARAAAMFPDEQKDALDYVCAWLEDGKTMLELARSMTAEKYPDAAIDDDTVIHFSPNIVRRVLLDLYDREKVDQRLRDSRTVGAHAMVDRATDILDSVDAYTKEAVSLAKERANVRLWSAPRYNRAELGDVPKTQVNVQVNNGEAHVTSMLRRRVVVARPDALAAAHAGLELPAGSAVVIEAGESI